MKTFLRVLRFASPLSRFVPRYAVLAILSVVFGLLNLTLLIPLLNVLFKLTPNEIPAAKPIPSFDISFVYQYFNYYFNRIFIEKGGSSALLYVCGVIFVTILFANLFRYLSQRVMSSMRSFTVMNIRQALFNKITVLDLSYFFQSRKGDLLSNLSNDVNEIENSVVSSVQIMFREPLMIIGNIVVLLIMSVKLTLFSLIVLPLSGLIISLITKRLRKDAKEGQQLLGNLLSIIEETISGIRIIKAFNGQEYVKKKFAGENQRYRSVLKNMWNRKELATPISEFLGVFVVIGIVLYGGNLVLSNQSELTASQFITYIILFARLLEPAKNISVAVTNIQRGIVAGERIFGILDADVTIKDKEHPIQITDFNHSIEYRNVSFNYIRDHEGLVLNNVNLKIEKGKTIALVGQSGSGKTTLADLLPRFYDLEQGEILIDGENIKDYRLHDLRKLMGIVTQESILFNDTVFNNIAFGMEHAKEEDVIAAAKIANAHNFIMEMPDGYRTNIGDRGGKMSGGQRQRISIARAVLKNPPILILDEATSALDTESERLVQDALIKLMTNRTVLVIAHRLSTIQHADEIIVMQKGEITERGTHSALIENSTVYKKLYELQSFN